MYTSLFPCYGGKSKLAHLYPKPLYSLIIEPFAGAAAYSLLHREGRLVLLSDINKKVATIWRFLLSDTALEWIRLLPDEVEKSMHIDSILPVGAPPGLRYLVEAMINRGTMSGGGNQFRVSPWGQEDWHRVKPKMMRLLPLRRWHFFQKDYRTLPNGEATWYIDPPYSSSAGRLYERNEIDYEELAAWCLSRRGQVIVCEQEGASWLPFSCIIRLEHGRGQKHKTQREVYWVSR